MPATIDRNALKLAAILKFGAPYKFGSKWMLSDTNPQGPIDCSGYSRWCLLRGGAEVPEGSTAQHADSVPIDKKFTRVGDYMFLKTADPDIEHHVEIVYDDLFTIGARGARDNNGNEIGLVGMHLRSEWEARPDFLGYFRAKSVVAIEGA